MTAIAIAAVLSVSIFGGNLMSLQAMASTDNSTNVNATVNTNDAGVKTHASISEKQTARQTLRQTLQQDEMAYKQAVQTADVTYKQAVQTAQLAHSQAIQDANTANNQAIQLARVTYTTAVNNAHGNAVTIGTSMATRDQSIATSQTTRINAVVSADVAHDKAVNDAWATHETAVYGALATRDGNDGTAQSTFYTSIGNATLSTRSQTIGQAHVTEDNSILQSRETRITAVETADIAKDQAIGTAQTVYISAESSAHVTLDNTYTTNAKNWNAGLQSYWNSVAPLVQTQDSAIAAANANHVTAIGNADAARDQAIDQAFATMYGSISTAYS